MPSSVSTSRPARTNRQACDSPGSTRPETYLIKLGGSLDEEIRRACVDVQSLWQQGHRVVIVHGGSAAANQLGRELGRPEWYLTSPDGKQRARYTDPDTLDTLMLAMLGRVKPRLVTELARRGVSAVGVSGVDGNLLTATPTPPVRARVADGELRVVRDDMTGRVSAVDPGLLELLLDGGYVPVISPPVLGAAGEPLSTDADRLAAKIAAALSAAWLIVLSNVPGLLRDPADEATVIRNIPISAVDEYLAVASGRMRVKLLAAAEAAREGVRHVILADGRRDAPVLAARSGAGTAIVPKRPT